MALCILPALLWGCWCVMRDKILSLLSGQKNNRPPAFSGLIHVTIEGLAHEGLSLQESHRDAQKMARAAASTYRLTGMPSAALPLDLCAPAEALGAALKYYEDVENQFPQPKKPLFGSVKDLNQAYFQSADFLSQARLPVICDAIRTLKADIGSEVVISGLLPGPYTLLLYLIDLGGLFAEMKREPNAVQEALCQLCTFLAGIGAAYRAAGADFITIHEMGGSPGFIGPAKFEQFVFPALKQLIGDLPAPAVLSICGNTNKSMHLLAQAGARAVSVDQTNAVAASRVVMGNTCLFGNIDPVAVLQLGGEAEIREAVHAIKNAGVDAIWPGCDLVPLTPLANISTMLQSAA
jgi:[methyl-Co(III) methanol-specific corrinoid protein]:coenzyme M methyltransferase